MIHSLLGGIPELVDAEPEFYDTGNNEGAATEVDRAVEDETVSAESAAISSHISEHTHVASDTLAGNEDELVQSTAPSDVAQGGDTFQANSSNPSAEAIPVPKATEESVDGPHGSTLELAASIPLPDSPPASPIPFPGPSSVVLSSTPLPQEATFVDHHSASPSIPDHALSRSPSSSDLTRPSIQSSTVANRPTSQAVKTVSSKSRTKPPPLSLTYLLRQADDLLTAYPPSHPSLHVIEILGPDSAMRTWRPLPISTKARDAVPEKMPYNYTDEYLETLVNSSYIVTPSPPPSPSLGPRRLAAKKTKVSPKALSKALFDPRRIGMRLGALTPAERRMLFMGALLVVGAAMALKSGRVPCVGGIVKTSGGDGLKRLWNGRRTLISSVVAAWGRGLP